MISRNLFRFAIGGQARSGKTTAAEHFANEHGGKVLPIAAPLYDVLSYAQATCGFPIKKDREFLQWVGTDWARKQNQDVWIDLLMEEVEKSKDITNIYVPDLRFPNEVERLKKEGFFMIKIERYAADKDRSFGSGSRAHESESALDSISDNEWDFIVKNNSSLTEFYSSLDKICYQIEYSQRILDTYIELPEE